MIYKRITQRLKVGGKFLLILTWLMCVTAPMVIGQTVSSPPQNTDTKPLAFDVVSIKLNRSGAANARMNVTPDGIQMLNVLPAIAIREAYGLGYNQQLQNVPDWSISERVDIVAKVASADIARFRNLTLDQTREMLLPVLTDRFKLSVHQEMKDLPIYDLVLLKSGPKFTEGTPDPKYPDGNLDRQSTSITMQYLPIDSLTFALTRQLGRTVVDKTELKGRYDLKLQWTPDEDIAPTQSSGTPELSIFTAIQEQLGLKLVPSKGPVECIFIDHVEKPSDN